MVALAFSLITLDIVVAVASWSPWGERHLPERVTGWPSFIAVVTLYAGFCLAGYLAVKA